MSNCHPYHQIFIKSSDSHRTNTKWRWQSTYTFWPSSYTFYQHHILFYHNIYFDHHHTLFNHYIYFDHRHILFNDQIYFAAITYIFWPSSHIFYSNQIYVDHDIYFALIKCILTIIIYFLIVLRILQQSQRWLRRTQSSIMERLATSPCQALKW